MHFGARGGKLIENVINDSKADTVVSAFCFKVINIRDSYQCLSENIFGLIS